MTEPFYRLLTDRPASYRRDRLKSAHPGIKDVNEVDTPDGPMLACYVRAGHDMTEAEWAQIVADHDPAPDPPSDEERARDNVRGLKAKAKQVFDGNGQFSDAEVQKILAGLVLRQ